MTAPPFVHLRVHSEYSLIDGLVRVKPLVARCEALAMPAVGLTDHNNLFALLKFYGAARSAGVKPIVGCDLALRDEKGGLSQVTVFVENATGYGHLTRLISGAYLAPGRASAVAGAKADLLAKNEGLLLLLGRHSPLGAVAEEGEVAFDEALAPWQEAFGDRLFFELTRTGRAGEEGWLAAAMLASARCGVPVVATNDVRFLEADDYEAHETRVCIHEGRVLGDPRRPRRYSEAQYFCSAEEMQARFEDIPEALSNTVVIAQRCNLTLALDTYYLPEYPIPEGETLEGYFRRISWEGLAARLARLPALPEDGERGRKAYQARLQEELDIICQMDFPGYFLIVAEFIAWAKDNGVPVGPGRGSGAGSLVAYALGITNLDPLAYDLLFERFLNPERVSMPDFDVDFCMEGRDRVIGHVADLYGTGAVSQIVTYGTMAAKAVVRDVARVQGKPYGLADKLSKMIPFEVGMTLHKALEQEPTLKAFVEESEEVSEIMDMAFSLEGLVRNIGKHAGGVVIAPGQLTDFVPLVTDEQGALMTQFDKDDVERAGLVKFDFLGLRTLTIINWALEAINAQRAAQDELPLDIDAIPLDDDRVFGLLKRAETTAVFQLESRGMKELIKRLLPDSFEDIVALVALFRPGPLQSGMVDDFIDRKHGRATVTYPHPALEPILSNTYGVILYQEQVMQIAQVLAGYTLGGADLLRRAMGKKKPEEMAKQREIFLTGAAAQGIDGAIASPIFDLMEKFAGYGFNKSHSAAYALVSYQTAWLKHHYPAPFMAAVMSSDMQNTDKIVVFIEEARQMGLTLRPPDVNYGAYRFQATAEGEIIYGLGAIKGVGEGPIEAIVASRTEAGPYEDLFDLCRRVDARRLGKRVLEALIRAGALDSLAPKTEAGPAHRGALLAQLDEALQAAEQALRNDAAGMGDLFGGLEAPAPPPGLTVVRPLSEHERLRGEKETLGLYLTGHPIDSYEDELRSMVPTRLSELKADRGAQLVAGLVVDLRVVRTKRGDAILFATIDDRSSRLEILISGEVLDAHREKLVKDAVLLFEGELSFDDFSGALRMRRCQGVFSMTEARQRFAVALELCVSQKDEGPGFATQLAEALGPYRGEGCPVAVHYRRCDAEVRLRLSDEWRVLPSDDLLERLRERLPVDRVALRYPEHRGS